VRFAVPAVFKPSSSGRVDTAASSRRDQEKNMAPIPNTTPGITVITNLTAGENGLRFNHAEGIVVTTDLKAGGGRGVWNRAEGVVVADEK
jgi:hypothetical protein